MKQSNFSRLIKQYVTQKTSKRETSKIGEMLEAIGKRDIHFIADETEELLFQKIKENEVHPDEITVLVRGLCKLRVSDIQWMKFKGMDVYFARDAY